MTCKLCAYLKFTEEVSFSMIVFCAKLIFKYINIYGSSSDPLNRINRFFLRLILGWLGLAMPL